MNEIEPVSASALELLPADPASQARRWRPTGRIPKELRAFGKFLDTSSLAPGDLILTREQEPDRVSREIAGVQAKLGYGPNDAKWTHAAVYLGDGTRLMEATFDGVLKGGSVRASYLYNYCGSHGIRIRRPRHVPASPMGWLIAVEAAMGIGQKYDFAAALELFWEAQSAEREQWKAESRTYVSPGVLCSTFYADCYNRVTRRCLGDSGICVPASLSVNPAFDDVRLQWLPIE